MSIEQPVLTETQEELFRTRGLLRLPALLPTENAGRSREEIVRLCERAGVWKQGRWYRGSSVAQRKLLKRLKKSTDRGSFMTPRVHDAMTALVDGAALTSWSAKPELLFSRPRGRDDAPEASSREPASRPARGPFPWHVDVPRLVKTGVVGVQMFTFLDTVAPGGGGPAVVTGSHRLLNDRRSAPA